MKLQFDANQDYQLEAIQAVVSLFEGQPDASQISVARDDEPASLKLAETGVANQRVITDEQWLANLSAVQKVHGIEPQNLETDSRYERGEAVPMRAVVNLFKILDKHPELVKELV